MEIFKTENSLVNIVKGVLVSFLCTIICLLIFSILLAYTNLSEETISPVIITITGINILIGSSIGTRKLRKNGMITGGIIGLIYILSIYILSSIINSSFSLGLNSIIMIMVGLVGGIVGGIIGINTRRTK